MRSTGQLVPSTVRSAPNSSTAVSNHGRIEWTVQPASRMPRPEIFTTAFGALATRCSSRRQYAKYSAPRSRGYPA